MSLCECTQVQRVKKGDRVAIYMPMIPELTIGVLACARIGAVHSVVLLGFLQMPWQTALMTVNVYVYLLQTECTVAKSLYL